jgi:hypothetical protein
MSKILSKSLIGSSDVSFQDAPLVSVPFTTVANRALIRDLTKDMAPLFGIKRIPVQNIVELTNEQGPAGDRVWAAVNDDRGLIRFVGNWAQVVDGNTGQRVRTDVVGDYVEITFYGTGLNMLTTTNASASDWRASVDGGGEGANLWPTTHSAILFSRNWPANEVIPVVSGLGLGVHTVKIRCASNGLPLNGFEVISQVSEVQVLSGSLVKDQRRVTLETTQSLPYKPTALTGTRGGRVVLYNTGSAIASAVQAVNPAAAYLTLADHTNEEISRAHSIREFGAGRTDDFSNYFSASSTNLSFVLDDGTTSLVGGQMSIQSRNSREALVATAASSYWVFTFVGTGCDILATNNGASTANYTLIIDGVSQGTIVGGSTATRIIKLASGLPYGTHTVKILNNGGNTHELDIFGWIAYQPKKPSVPANAVEIADYNVMADFAANTGTDALSISQGTIRKHTTREHQYIGTGWVMNACDPAAISGIYLHSPTTGDSYRYTFFGTGFDLRFYAATAAYNFTISVDGSTNLSGFTTSTALNGTLAFTPSTGTVAGTPSAPTYGESVVVRGLALGVHTVVVTRGAMAATFFQPGSFDIITPIHASKSNSWYDQQNTQPVGSCALSDSRPLTTPEDSQKKAFSIAQGSVSSPSTTSTSFVPYPDMSTTITLKKAGELRILAAASSQMTSGSSSNLLLQIYVNGLPVGFQAQQYALSTVPLMTTTLEAIVPVPAGTHKVDLYWRSDGVTWTGITNQRMLIVEER